METLVRDGVALRFAHVEGELPDEGRGSLEIPSLFIAADDRPLSDPPHLFRLAPDMLFGQTVGSGHFCTLEVPDQINAMLARFMAVLPSLRAA